LSLCNKIKSIPLKSRVFSFKTKDITINYTDSIDSIVNEMTQEEFGEDERFPYYITIWDSGPVLATWLIENIENIDTMTILELGSGTGVTGVALATAGCRLIFTDYEEYSVELCARNAIQNGIKNYDCLTADWRNFPDIDEKIDMVVCSDVLYEEKQVIPLYSVIKKYLKLNTAVYISDPQRGHINTFIDLLQKDNFSVKPVYQKINGVTPFKTITIYEIKNIPA